MIKKNNKTQKIVWLLFAGVFLNVLFWTAGYYTLSIKLNELDKGSSFSSESYKAHYAFITEDSNDEFWNKVYEAAKEKGEENNVYVELFGADLQRNYSVSQLFEMAIESRVDGIIINPNGDDFVSQIELASRRGIPVVTILDDCKSDDQICFVGISRYNLGLEYGKQILSMGRKQIKKIVVLLEDNEQIESQKLVVAGIRDKIKGYNFELRTEKIRKKSTFHAEEDIRNIILDQEKKPDVFICLTGDDTDCTIQQIIEFNQVGRIRLIGYFDSENAKEAINKRIVHSVIGVDGNQMGKRAVQAMVNYRMQIEISAVYDIDVYKVDYGDINS